VSREEALYLLKIISLAFFIQKSTLISILYIKNTNETASILVVLEAIQNSSDLENIAVRDIV
jgi:hypothetical protein